MEGKPMSVEELGRLRTVSKSATVGHWSGFRAELTPKTVHRLLDEIERLRGVVDGYRAALQAYAGEFNPDANGNPDVGSIHANIRQLKEERDNLRAEIARMKEVEGCEGCKHENHALVEAPEICVSCERNCADNWEPKC